MAAMTASPELLTVPEAAAVAGVSVRTMRRWASSGQVRTVGSGHGRKVVADSLSKVAASEDTNGHEKRSSDGTVSTTTDNETARSANADTAAIEADRLAVLVRELTDKLAEQTGLTMVWMERCRVLGDQLALAAPVGPEPTQDANLGAGAQIAITDAPVPLLARLRVLAPWVLAALVLVAVVLLLWIGVAR
jgi:hypothetical protein